MKKILLVLFLTLVGCNFGSSIADRSSAGGSGGATAKPSAGATGTSSTVAGTGGTTMTGTGGATLAGVGGMPGTGGLSGDGGSGVGGGSMSAGGATGGTTGGGPDAGTTAPGQGGGRGTGGKPGTGGTRGTGGAPGTGGTTGGGTTAACIPAATPGSRGMNSGQACLSCHIAGGRASSLAFTAAGTLYASTTGGAVVSGATVTITGSNNKKVTMVTASDGNFYTNSAIAFPATVQVSKCPDTQAMSATLSAGDCNSCHGSSMRLHLP